MIRIFTDGAAQPNPGHKGIGVVVEWQGKAPLIISEYTGEGSNNQAEYEALLRALGVIRNEEIKICTIHSDSNLMVQQVNGNWKCNDSTLIQYRDLAQKRLEWLKDNGFKVELVYIKREFNLADNPAKLGAKKEKR